MAHSTFISNHHTPIVSLRNGIHRTSRKNTHPKQIKLIILNMLENATSQLFY